MKWICENKFTTTITTTSATANIFTIPTGQIGVAIRGCGFGSTVTRTAGAFVETDTGEFELSDFTMTGPFIGVSVTGQSRTIRIYNGEIVNAVPSTGIGMLFNSLTTDVGVYNMVLTITNLSNRPAAQIKVLETGDLSMELVQTFGGIVDLLMNPSSTQVSSFKCFNCWFDGPLNQGVLLQPSGTGGIAAATFVGSWFGNAQSGGTGLSVFPNGASAIVQSINFVGCEFYNNSTAGIQLSASLGGTVKNFSFNGGRIAGHTVFGILIDGATGTIVNGMTIGDGVFGNNGTGIDLASAADNNTISGNLIIGNTTAVANSASGTHNVIINNTGYNPVGATSITVGASPFTYTAGASPETVYILAGTVSAIATQGRTVGTSTNAGAPVSVDLGPNEAVQVTYSSIPFMNKSIH